MKKTHQYLLRIVSTAALCGLLMSAASAQVRTKDVDVNVTNTPDVIIANQAPIPVTVDNTGVGGSDFVSVRASELIDDSGQRVTIEGFRVPAGKVFIAEYVSLFMDVVVGNRPTTELRIAARLGGNGTDPFQQFELGYMEEHEMTSRGTPNFIMAREVKLYFTEGPVNCIAETRFGGVNLNFGVVDCALSGRLVDAP